MVNQNELTDQIFRAILDLDDYLVDYLVALVTLDYIQGLIDRIDCMVYGVTFRPDVEQLDPDEQKT